MGACLRSLYLSRAGAVAGAVAGVFSRPCPESRSRRLGPALATRCMRRLLFIAPGAVAGAPSSPRTGDAARACPRFVAGWGGGERSRRDRCRSAFGHVALEKGTRYYLTDPDCHIRFCGEALGTSAALCTVCSHRTIALYEGGLSTSPFRRCSFTPHPPIRLRTQRLCVRKLYKPGGGDSSRLRAPLCCCVTLDAGTHRWYGTYTHCHTDRGDRSFRCPSD